LGFGGCWCPGLSWPGSELLLTTRRTRDERPPHSQAIGFALASQCNCCRYCISSRRPRQRPHSHVPSSLSSLSGPDDALELQRPRTAAQQAAAPATIRLTANSRTHGGPQGPRSTPPHPATAGREGHFRCWIIHDRQSPRRTGPSSPVFPRLHPPKVAVFPRKASFHLSQTRHVAELGADRPGGPGTGNAMRRCAERSLSRPGLIQNTVIDQAARGPHGLSSLPCQPWPRGADTPPRRPL
jgi:hypothetical protein